MNNMEKVKEFDKYVQENYKEIKRSANTICKSYTNSDVDDIINETYIKLKIKITRDGFNSKNYAGYFWVSLKNNYGMDLRKKNRDKTVHIQDTHYNTNSSSIDYTYIVERMLQEQHDIVASSQQYDNDLMDITKELFEYIELIFDEKQVYLFKNYYLTPKSTYRKLAERTGYSIMDCSNTMKMMKKKIREDFIDWYKNKYNE